MAVDIDVNGDVAIVIASGFINNELLDGINQKCHEILDAGTAKIVLDLYRSRSGYLESANRLSSIVESLVSKGAQMHFTNMSLMWRDFGTLRPKADFKNYQAPVFSSRKEAVIAFAQETQYSVKFTGEVRLIPITEYLLAALRRDAELLHSLSPEQFELLICERLDAMGHEIRRTGHTYSRDGGVDIIAWSRESVFPMLLAVQVKHSTRMRKVGPSPIKEMGAVISTTPFAAGLIVTNTTFTPTAKWWTQSWHHKIRLRDFNDVTAWIEGNFLENEYRDIPDSIELVPGFPQLLK